MPLPETADQLFPVTPKPKPKPVKLADPAKRVPGTLHLPAVAWPR
jgi:hypothetical protein